MVIRLYAPSRNTANVFIESLVILQVHHQLITLVVTCISLNRTTTSSTRRELRSSVSSNSLGARLIVSIFNKIHMSILRTFPPCNRRTSSTPSSLPRIHTRVSYLHFFPNGDCDSNALLDVILLFFIHTSTARSSSSVRAVGNVRKQVTMDRLESETKRSEYESTRDREISLSCYERDLYLNLYFKRRRLCKHLNQDKNKIRP